MQRQRIVDAMGLLWRCRHPRDDEPNPMAALRVNHEDPPIEVEKHIERRIARRRHILLVIILKQLKQSPIPSASGPWSGDHERAWSGAPPAMKPGRCGGSGAARKPAR